jgi:CRISPR-associated protein Csb1
MNEILTSYDGWLKDDGAAALVIREYLQAAEGPDGVIFPPTFAARDDFPGGYNIDEFPDGENVCLLDSVGSQANRIEPLFGRGEYAGLVPQVVIKAGEKEVNLLEAGHRAADAIVRCSALQDELRAAFRGVLAGNSEPLARLAPTSLVFGAWDSRDTQAKLPRLITSTIRAFNVRRLSRSAQYFPAASYVEEGLLDEPVDKMKDSYAKRGFVHVPSSATAGGVIAIGGIRRDASLHLAALRLLAAGADAQKTLALRRYILGLALTAFTYSPSGYLRQGCNLVLDPKKPREFVEVHGDGGRTPAAVTHEGALKFAQEAGRAFGVGEPRSVEFDREKAKQDLTDEKEQRKARAKKTA